MTVARVNQEANLLPVFREEYQDDRAQVIQFLAGLGAQIQRQNEQLEALMNQNEALADRVALQQGQIDGLVEQNRDRGDRIAALDERVEAARQQLDHDHQEFQAFQREARLRGHVMNQRVRNAQNEVVRERKKAELREHEKELQHLEAKEEVDKRAVISAGAIFYGALGGVLGSICGPVGAVAGAAAAGGLATAHFKAFVNYDKAKEPIKTEIAQLKHELRID